ncbi:hypothetical protein [Bacillus changyiensis]|uniref:hypothetical protein n=1 Tax=Bacillus changyiensis TaxID=3004103 RepID=UPI0022E09A16|nr:hypothetical protein [Bacillus changyiensis]MDA1476872.1 hypothetical protein [Bacillus changyiensis]
MSYKDNIYKIMRSDTDGLRYYQYSDKELQKFYKPIFSEKKNPLKKLHDLTLFNFLERRNIQNKLRENLPDLVLDQKNVLTVKTTTGEKKFELPSAKGKKIYLSLLGINKENMLIQTEVYEKLKNGDLGKGNEYYLFLKQDFSKHQVVKKEKLYPTIESGKLNDYLSVFPKVSEDGSYLKLFDNYILEKKTNKVREVKNSDYLSVDGKYVYLNGAKEKISDGIQQIQTVDNYLKGNDKYEAEFKLDFENIADEMDFKSSGVSIAQTCYFNKNYVVLRVSYNGIIVGTAGAVNVLVDLTNKKQPTAYLVDLGVLSTKVY